MTFGRRASFRTRPFGARSAGGCRAASIARALGRAAPRTARVCWEHPPAAAPCSRPPRGYPGARAGSLDRWSDAPRNWLGAPRAVFCREAAPADRWRPGAPWSDSGCGGSAGRRRLVPPVTGGAAGGPAGGPAASRAARAPRGEATRSGGGARPRALGGTLERRDGGSRGSAERRRLVPPVAGGAAGGSVGRRPGGQSHRPGTVAGGYAGRGNNQKSFRGHGQGVVVCQACAVRLTRRGDPFRSWTDARTPGLPRTGCFRCPSGTRAAAGAGLRNLFFPPRAAAVAGGRTYAATAPAACGNVRDPWGAPGGLKGAWSPPHRRGPRRQVWSFGLVARPGSRPGPASFPSRCA